MSEYVDVLLSQEGAGEVGGLAVAVVRFTLMSGYTVTGIRIMLRARDTLS
jgi:hypothetical protein